MTKQEHGNMIKSKIEELAKLELEAANSRHPLFASNHEAYAVILEEVEEATEELAHIKSLLSLSWKSVRHDYKDNFFNDIGKVALSLAQEAIQVAAMCDKALMSDKARGGSE